LGPSLSDLFYKQQKIFSLKSVLMLASHMLDRLEILHERGVVHRDIKPGNFVMGRGENDSCVYLIDFGLSHKYRSSNGIHIKYEDNVPFRGTHRYASINAHMKVEQTRRDDLESLGYVLIYFLKGGLPWQNMNVEKNRRRQVIGEMKKNTSIKEITAGLPDVFAIYLSSVRKLRFDERPDYTSLRDLFQNNYIAHNFTQDSLYDWSLPKHTILPNENNKTNSPTKSFVLDTLEHIEIIEGRSKPQSPLNTRKRKNSDITQEMEVQNRKVPKNNRMNLRPRRKSTTTVTSLSPPEIIEISD